jgi:4-alpha-glucanotransferase
MLLMGDLPFVVCTESSDVWAHQDLFQVGKSLGAPPDEFDPEFGQDWGLPPYDWKALEKTDYAWIRARTRHAARLYHAFRLDHVIGCFRQYVRMPKELGVFDPLAEKDAEANGRKVLSAVVEAARPAKVIGEDLGVIPPWARKVLKDLGLAGYRVLPWEKDDATKVPRDPKKFPPLSLATWSTHDTAPLAAWWKEFTEDDKAAFAKAAGIEPDAPDAERAVALMRHLYSAGSDLVLVQAAEIFGEEQRINTPGTVGEQNWTYRLSRTLEALEADPNVVRTMQTFAELARGAGRGR